MQKLNLKTPNGPTDSQVEESKVKFRDLSDEEINEYIETGEPMDKAGAYAIQGIAAKFIEKIEGDEMNIIGLPLDRLISMLNTNFSLNVKRKY